jgi:hypothetical protein
VCFNSVAEEKGESLHCIKVTRKLYGAHALGLLVSNLSCEYNSSSSSLSSSSRLSENVAGYCHQLSGMLLFWCFQNGGIHLS